MIWAQLECNHFSVTRNSKYWIKKLLPKNLIFSSLLFVRKTLADKDKLWIDVKTYFADWLWILPRYRHISFRQQQHACTARNMYFASDHKLDNDSHPDNIYHITTALMPIDETDTQRIHVKIFDRSTMENRRIERTIHICSAVDWILTETNCFTNHKHCCAQRRRRRRVGNCGQRKNNKMCVLCEQASTLKDNSTPSPNKYEEKKNELEWRAKLSGPRFVFILGVSRVYTINSSEMWAKQKKLHTHTAHSAHNISHSVLSSIWTKRTCFRKLGKSG